MDEGVWRKVPKCGRQCIFRLDFYLSMTSKSNLIYEAIDPVIFFLTYDEVNIHRKPKITSL